MWRGGGKTSHGVIQLTNCVFISSLAVRGKITGALATLTFKLQYFGTRSLLHIYTCNYQQENITGDNFRMNAQLHSVGATTVIRQY